MISLSISCGHVSGDVSTKRSGEKFNRKQGQGFIGIRSGLSGETVIMLPVWSNVPGQPGTAELHLRLTADCEVEETVLGTVRYVTYGKLIPCVLETDGTLVELTPVITTTDAAMDILQYLSDARDPRLWLEHYAGTEAVVRPKEKKETEVTQWE